MNRLRNWQLSRWPLIGLTLLLVTGCGGYGEISPTAYEYAKALYSITNRKASESLDSVRDQIIASLEAGDLSQKEADWLTNIIEDSRAGEWQSANSSARRMMEDQIQ